MFTLKRIIFTLLCSLATFFILGLILEIFSDLLNSFHFSRSTERNIARIFGLLVVGFWWYKVPSFLSKSDIPSNTEAVLNGYMNKQRIFQQRCEWFKNANLVRDIEEKGGFMGLALACDDPVFFHIFIRTYEEVFKLIDTDVEAKKESQSILTNPILALDSVRKGIIEGDPYRLNDPKLFQANLETKFIGFLLAVRDYFIGEKLYDSIDNIDKLILYGPLFPTENFKTIKEIFKP